MKKSRGFTLIELMVVIAIISLLSSVVLASLSKARGKAQDAKRQLEIQQISLALRLFYEKMGRMPLDHNQGRCTKDFGYTGTCSTDPGGNALGTVYYPETGNFDACDGPTSGQLDGTTNNREAYDLSMQELVDQGFMSSIIYSPGNGAPYCYKDYGPGNGGPTDKGARMQTFLLNTAKGADADESCYNFCRAQTSDAYCVCNPY